MQGDGSGGANDWGRAQGSIVTGTGASLVKLESPDQARSLAKAREDLLQGRYAPFGAGLDLCHISCLNLKSSCLELNSTRTVLTCLRSIWLPRVVSSFPKVHLKVALRSRLQRSQAGQASMDADNYDLSQPSRAMLYYMTPGSQT